MDRQTFGCLGALACFIAVGWVSYRGFSVNAEQARSTSVRRGMYQGYAGEAEYRRDDKELEWKKITLYSQKDEGYIEAYDNKGDSRLDIISMVNLSDGDSLGELASLDELEKAFEVISGASSE